MTTIDADILRDVRGRHEVAIRTGMHPDSNVVVWAVAVDDAVLIKQCWSTARQVLEAYFPRHGHA